MYWEDQPFVEALVERGSSIHNGATFHRFIAMFGRRFVPFVEEPRFLDDHIQMVAFREMLLATFVMIHATLSRVGFDVPASAVARIVRLTPTPVMIPKMLSARNVRLIWMHLPCVSDEMKRVFLSGQNPAVDQRSEFAAKAVTMRRNHGWLNLGDGEAPIAASELDHVYDDPGQFLLGIA